MKLTLIQWWIKSDKKDYSYKDFNWLNERKEYFNLSYRAHYLWSKLVILRTLKKVISLIDVENEVNNTEELQYQTAQKISDILRKPISPDKVKLIYNNTFLEDNYTKKDT